MRKGFIIMELKHNGKDVMKYSFIIPVFNSESYLKQCVKSILSQSFPDYEIILIDDGSTDKSRLIEEELSWSDKRVKFILKENSGAAGARNMGIENAAGQYLIFVDSDDTIESTLLEEIEKVLSGSDPILPIYGMSFDYYRNGALEKREVQSLCPVEYLSINRVYEQYYDLFYSNIFSSACNKVFDLSIIRKNNLRYREDMVLYEDYVFVLSYMRYISGIRFINQGIYHYRHDSGDKHSRRRLENMSVVKKNMSYVCEAALRIGNDWKMPERYPQLYEVTADLYIQMAKQNLLLNNYSVKEIEELLTDYIQDDQYTKLIQKKESVKPRVNEFLQQIREGKFTNIYKGVRNQKRKAAIKSRIKRLLKR